MRNTQLDSSMPRAHSGGGGDGLPFGEEPVPIRYLPPIVVTLAAALALVFFFAILALIASNISYNLLTAPEGDGSLLGTAGCGLVALLLLGATLYFINAARIAAQDLRAAPVQVAGKIVAKHTGRGRNGGFWIVLRPADLDPSPAARAAAPAGALDPPPAAVPGPAAEESPARERGFVNRNAGSFGAHIQNIEVTPRAPGVDATPPRALPDTRRKIEPGEINLRIDKHIYEALAQDDQVQAVFSRHLQHVYYIRKPAAGGGSLILRNMALI